MLSLFSTGGLSQGNINPKDTHLYIMMGENSSWEIAFFCNHRMFEKGYCMLVSTDSNNMTASYHDKTFGAIFSTRYSPMHIPLEHTVGKLSQDYKDKTGTVLMKKNSYAITFTTKQTIFLLQNKQYS